MLSYPRSPTPPEDRSPPRSQSPHCVSWAPEVTETWAQQTEITWSSSDFLPFHDKWFLNDTVPAPPELASPHRYHAIQDSQVRLLRLAPGDQGDPLRCALKPVDLRRIAHVADGRRPAYKYQALSYAWGDEEPTENLMINVEPNPQVIDDVFRQSLQDDLRNKAVGLLKIRPNLMQALVRLRAKKEAIWLWVDAICINQEDELEKNHQLTKMPTVFGNAWSVAIWIGHDSDPTAQDMAMKFIPTILNLTLLDRLLARSKPEEATLKYWVAFAALLRRPWFSRRWVIQEVAFAKRAALRCGDNIVNWLDFVDAVELFFRKLNRIRALYSASELSKQRPDALNRVESAGALALLQASNGVLRKGANGAVLDRLWRLEALVMRFTSFETTDPRDTVYALMSLASDVPIDSNGAEGHSDETEGHQTLISQYHRDPVDTFIDFVKSCIETSGSLDVICRHWAPALKEEMPSWIGLVDQAPFGPPGRFMGRINGDSLVGDPGSQVFNASKGTKASVTFPLFQDAARVERHPHSADQDNKKRKRQDDDSESVDMTLGEGTPVRETQPADGSARPAQNAGTHQDLSTQGEKTSTTADRSKSDQSQTPEQGLRIRHFKGTLLVKGLVLRRIRRVSPRVVDGTISDECLELLGWQRGNGAAAAATDVNEIPDPLWRTLVADRGFNGRNAPTWCKRACAHALTRTSPEGDLNTSKILERAVVPDLVMEFLRRVQSVVWSRKFFETGPWLGDQRPAAVAAPAEAAGAGAEDSAPLVGMGSRHIRARDLVCILFGCSVPVILRPLGTSAANKTVTVRSMGECFVYGKMDGEAFAGLSKDDVDARTVTFEMW
ncbi:uncharacterized protein JN550_004085 [Neoarthrinium moseri]|uniref:uncharacterized protein n=1 Tax=Neoarthrinium moseri TaxID=1658444 RepID=UPI001FDB09DF|nr:uncharacterized protein JN550_004085 [Neoarthrinium moseri]KAI1872366.1 hypothetical protein JN550_004085 [Neoarthrinium moseri]